MREAPTDIKLKRDEGILEISWSDETPRRYDVKRLRRECGCAGCVDERTGVRTLDVNSVPDDIGITHIELVGNYALRPLRAKLFEHEVYRSIKTQDDLRTFMEHHVFAVWDFMSLLKALQGRLTRVTIPWFPQGDRNARRLINEIVLEEESDEDGEGGYISHFELYRAAMDQCGANTSRIDAFMGRVQHGQPVLEVLATTGVPKAAQAFVRTTWRIVESGPTHSIAAAFTLGREDLIPNMFRALVVDLDKSFPGQWHRLRYYLERHIQLDEEHHAPLALQMLTGLCGHDEENWREAEKSARVALMARIALWDDVLEELSAYEKRGLTSTHR